MPQRAGACRVCPEDLAFLPGRHAEWSLEDSVLGGEFAPFHDAGTSSQAATFRIHLTSQSPHVTFLLVSTLPRSQQPKGPLSRPLEPQLVVQARRALLSRARAAWRPACHMGQLGEWSTLFCGTGGPVLRWRRFCFSLGSEHSLPGLRISSVSQGCLPSPRELPAGSKPLPGLLQASWCCS